MNSNGHKERPILFSSEMVRAILEGRKTQTRRVMKSQPHPNGIWSKSLDDFMCINDSYPPSAILWEGGWLGHDAGEEFCCPYGKSGDRLWVRETWKPLSRHSNPTTQNLPPVMDGVAPTYETERGVCFAADSAIIWSPHKTIIHDLRRDAPSKAKQHLPAPDKWKPSIFMPRWASRITLEITNVRVERLQEISEADATAEGVAPVPFTRGGWDANELHRDAFADGWDSLNAKRGYGWDKNPWVWVIEFKRFPIAA